jgi:hypothetical protein
MSCRYADATGDNKTSRASTAARIFNEIARLLAGRGDDVGR